MFPPRSLTFYHSQILQMPNPKSRYSKVKAILIKKRSKPEGKFKTKRTLMMINMGISMITMIIPTFAPI